MNLRSLVPALLLPFFAMPALAAPADPLPRAKPESVGFSSARLSHIDEVLRADIEAGRMPGAVVAIARKGKLVYFKAFGYRDKAANVPMTTDTIFAIASMTKPMVTVGALQLYEQGRVPIDDPVSKFLPQFANMKVARMDAAGKEIIDTVPASRRITIQDIMRHTSGIIYGGRGSTAVHKLYPDSSSSAALEYTGPEFIDKLASLPLMYQPGTVWDYGFSIDVLGQVVESISKERLGTYLQQSLFQPLGMTDTGFMVPPANAARYARALPNDPDTGKPQSVLDLTKPTKFDCGGGCAVSTASDYMRFAQMLLNHGQLGGKQILSRKTVDFMTSNQLGPEVKNLIGAADPTRADYGFGLGMAVRTTPGIVRMMGSVGDYSWPGASGTNWWADPKEELAVVFMAQTPGPMRWHYRQKINALVYQALQ